LNEPRRVLIGVSGGIAAYKVCHVISALAKEGVAVRCILTQQAQAFISALTISTLSRHGAYVDEDFWGSQARPLHIELGEWADVFLIAPLTANTLSKLALGLADNLLTNTVLASTCPLLAAPAMNTDMWLQPPIQENWRRLRQWSRAHWVNPVAGVLACDRVGTGRMAEPEDILSHLHSLLETGGKRDLAGKRILVSAGGTREPIDPVRFIGNPSTGRMGVALAQAAHHRGATVTLIHGPLETALKLRLGGISAMHAPTAAAMHAALLSELPKADWVFMAAAVADVKPKQSSPYKLPKADLPDVLPLAPVPDIAADLASQKQPGQKLIGFAAQSGDILPPAQEKLHRKGLDAIVANPIDQQGSGFGSETNQATIIDRLGNQYPLPLCSKLSLAHRIIEVVAALPPPAG